MTTHTFGRKYDLIGVGRAERRRVRRTIRSNVAHADIGGAATNASHADELEETNGASAANRHGQPGVEI